ncbi:MAG: hypothetical protein BWK76_22405 [Desulfobulbaceae bacterium A2]|nr:MAG: hypothetical protein BWK76_22405 [Desulfobulbaceae bacterium A2]
MTPAEVLPFLSAAELVTLSPYLSERSLAPGELFFREGERDELVAFVLSGRLAVRKPTEFPGRWQTIALLDAGAVVGERGVLDHGQHGSTVVALEETRLLLLAHDGFVQLTHGAPGIAIAILRHLLSVTSLRLQKTSQRLSLVL